MGARQALSHNCGAIEIEPRPEMAAMTAGARRGAGVCWGGERAIYRGEYLSVSFLRRCRTDANRALAMTGREAWRETCHRFQKLA